MGENFLGPPYKDFLTCLLPEPRAHITLCQRLEDTLFGCHLTDADSSGGSSHEGFRSTGSDGSVAVESSSGDSVHFMSRDAPSRLTWRNVVRSLVFLICNSRLTCF